MKLPLLDSRAKRDAQQRDNRRNVWLNIKREALMRVLVIATTLLMSTALVPSYAQGEEKPPAPDQTQITPVQPERTPQQSEQSRQKDRKSADDTRMGRDWRVQRDSDRMGRMDQEPRNRDHLGRVNDRDDWDRRTLGRNWQMQSDDRKGVDRRGYDDERSYYDEDRPRVRITICKEYENGDEVCRYRN
jgi:hypothetical protein